MKKPMQFVMLFAFLAALTAPLMGCHTMEGFGKDVQKVGEEIEEEADK